MRLTSQARDTVLLAEGPGGLYLIDQHRAHERALYDRLRAARPSAPQHELASPVMVPVPAGRYGAALRGVLEAAGFVCRTFAGHAFLIESAPALPGWEPSPDIMNAAVQEAAPDEDGWEDRLFAALACHSAVRRGTPLTSEQGYTLLAGLAESPEPGVCPHGSPIVLHLTESFLARRFRW
jgi:DNA mismatch repair protein MutL